MFVALRYGPLTFGLLMRDSWPVDATCGTRWSRSVVLSCLALLVAGLSLSLCLSFSLCRSLFLLGRLLGVALDDVESNDVETFKVLHVRRRREQDLDT